MLLYRILIEIRRHRAGEKDGIYGADVLDNRLLSERNKCRSIKIVRDVSGPYFFDGGEISFLNLDVKFGGLPLSVLSTVLGKKMNIADGSVYGIVRHDLRVDENMFHEITHWYHFLRDTSRVMNEKEGIDRSIMFYYYGGLIGLDDVSRCSISERKWSDLTKTLNLEEMRTMLGGGDLEGALNGDDLSENLYRYCTGEPLAFGYNQEMFYENQIVVDRCILSASGNFDKYDRFKEGDVNAKYKDVDFTYEEAEELGPRLHRSKKKD